MSSPTDVLWLCETLTLDRQVGTGFPNLAEALRDAGMPVLAMQKHDITPELADGKTICAWGSRFFLARVNETFTSGQRTVFDEATTQQYDLYAPHLRRLMLNGLYEVMSFGHAIDAAYRHAGAGIFVKPAFESKRFTGVVLNKANCAAKISELSYVADDVPCIVAPWCGNIRGEYRFVIADGKVVAGSQYRWHDKLDVRRDVMPEAENLAHAIAEKEWQAAGVYVCDVAVMTNGQAYVVELNPFSSSGLYACDTGKIAAALRKHAIKPQPANPLPYPA